MKPINEFARDLAHARTKYDRYDVCRFVAVDDGAFRVCMTDATRSCVGCGGRYCVAHLDSYARCAECGPLLRAYARRRRGR